MRTLHVLRGNRESIQLQLVAIMSKGLKVMSTQWAGDGSCHVYTELVVEREPQQVATLVFISAWPVPAPGGVQ